MRLGIGRNEAHRQARFARTAGTTDAVGVVHRLANSTAQDLEIVELQLGDLLDEDDIERLQDDYGRV